MDQVFLIVEHDLIVGKTIRSVFGTRPVAEEYKKACEAIDQAIALSIEAWLVK